MAFKWVYNLSGGAPTIQKWTVADAEVLSYGELVNSESQELDAGATGDTALLGAVIHDVDNTDDGETAYVIVNLDAVYEVTDANARNAGVTLDIASGGLTVTTTSNADLIVVENSSATEPTRVRIKPAAHAFGA